MIAAQILIPVLRSKRGICLLFAWCLRLKKRSALLGTGPPPAKCEEAGTGVQNELMLGEYYERWHKTVILLHRWITDSLLVYSIDWISRTRWRAWVEGSEAHAVGSVDWMLGSGPRV